MRGVFIFKATSMPILLSRYIPILQWGRSYNREAFSNDLIAAAIVTIMLVPQSLAYALLAGLPAQAGIYASIVPILFYAIFGTSRALAVGPVAVVSLLTASTIGEVATQGTAGYAVAALTLAFLSGAFLLALGILRLGFMANFLSHPVIAGFITASGILIAASQLGNIFGIQVSGHTLLEVGETFINHLNQLNIPTLIIGVGATTFLFWVRKGLKPLLLSLGFMDRSADIITKTGPVAAVVVTTLSVYILSLDTSGVKIVGDVPQGLPPFTLPSFSLDLLFDLLIPAILISIIGFVESISVAQTLAAKKRQRIEPNQELIGLGAANLGAAFTGGYPVTGGFARSVVNFDAGAQTPAAGAFTALGLAFASLTLTPLLYFLPKATLAATIIVAVLGLVDFSILKKTWRYSFSDFAAVAATITLTLIFGVETGISAGVLISIAMHLYKTSCPHVAELGLVAGTEHFRNVNRHSVVTSDNLLMLRVDESLYFVNARFLEDLIQARVADEGSVKNVVLDFAAVNEVDFSALESLEAINHRLRDLGVGLHLCNVKGPISDKLEREHFLHDLNGHIFLSNFKAWTHLS